MELQLSALKGAKTADYLKAFKNKALWTNKTNYAIILTGYKLDKKVPIALPYKKDAEAKAAFKQIKKEKTHPLNKTAVGTMAYQAEDNCFLFTINGGGGDPALIQSMGTKLFGKLKVNFKVEMGAIDPDMQVLAADLSPADLEPDAADVTDLEEEPFDWLEIETKAAQLFAQAQTFTQQPNAEQAPILHQNIVDFLASVKTAMQDAGGEQPTAALLKICQQLQQLAHRLAAKIEKPKNKINEAIAALAKEYSDLFKSVREEIIPLLKDPTGVVSAAQSEQVQKALRIIQDFRQQFPLADTAVRNKLADFFKTMELQEPQLVGVVQRIKNTLGKIILEARAKLNHEQGKIKAILAQLSPEARALVG